MIIERPFIKKYEIPDEHIKKNIARLTNQTWKLIPMRENEEDWGKQLDTVLIEVAGLNEVLCSRPQLLQIISKLEGIKIVKDIDFVIYRKTIFEIINLLQEIKNEV